MEGWPTTLAFCTAEFAGGSLVAARGELLKATGTQLGKGSVGTVTEFECPSGQQCVVKSINLKDAATLKRACIEAHVARQLQHELLPRYLACWSDEGSMYLVMQAFPGATSLLHLLRTSGPLPEARARTIAIQLVHVLDHLHVKHGLAYVDLKAENVLVRSEDDRIQLIDFDLCHPLPGSPLYQHQLQPRGQGAVVPLPRHLWLSHCTDSTGTAVQQEAGEPRFWGTLDYVAPEVVQQGKSASSAASDYWALGVLVFEMLYGHTPFQGPNTERILYNISMRGPVFPAVPEVGQRCQEFVRSLLRHRAEYRLGSQGAQEILSHSWLTPRSA